MTNEEAIKELKILREDYWDEYDDSMPALDMAIKALEQQSEDAISREAVLAMSDYIGEAPTYSNPYAKLEEVVRVKDIIALPPVQPKVGHCKDCKYFEYDHFENMGGIPLITAHKVCKRHGLICKTDEDGYCHLWEHKAESEPQGSEEKE